MKALDRAWQTAAAGLLSGKANDCTAWRKCRVLLDLIMRPGMNQR